MRPVLDVFGDPTRLLVVLYGWPVLAAAVPSSAIQRRKYVNIRAKLSNDRDLAAGSMMIYLRYVVFFILLATVCSFEQVGK